MLINQRALPLLLLQVNNTMISVFQRKRPRGDWMNVKMTGMAGESPVGFIKGENHIFFCI
jgi:hypothetical protein